MAGNHFHVLNHFAMLPEEKSVRPLTLPFCGTENIAATTRWLLVTHGNTFIRCNWWARQGHFHCIGLSGESRPSATIPTAENLRCQTACWFTAKTNNSGMYLRMKPRSHCRITYLIVGLVIASYRSPAKSRIDGSVGKRPCFSWRATKLDSQYSQKVAPNCP